MRMKIQPIKAQQIKKKIVFIFKVLVVLFVIFCISQRFAVSDKNCEKILRQSYATDNIQQNSTASILRLQEEENSTELQTANKSDIQRSIERCNLDQTVMNEEVFGPLQNDSTIVMVQVHKRVTYLRHLIGSLKQSRDISEALLIFSHDFYDEEINELVQSIDFCKVMQIFYPFSIQTHPHEFPGTDPKDCKRDVKKEQALVANCQNAHFPDLYGHYREASFTQTKHHWWWKANRVFDQLEVTRYHTGLVLFLEEDHYVAEDFLYLLRLMQKSSKDCAECNVLSLGTYKEKLQDDTSKVELAPWISNRHNMGFAIHHSTWQEIKSCAMTFCSYDDYNWDWSLQYLSDQCLTNKLFAMIAKEPRAFHLGKCGMHHKKKDCDEEANVRDIQSNLRDRRKLLFPVELQFTRKTDHISKYSANGGWSDLRDVKLCLNMRTELRDSSNGSSLMTA